VQFWIVNARITLRVMLSFPCTEKYQTRQGLRIHHAERDVHSVAITLRVMNASRRAQKYPT
jgi:hypothetical protein